MHYFKLMFFYGFVSALLMNFDIFTRKVKYCNNGIKLLIQWMVHSASLSNFSSHDYILVIYSMTNFSFTLLPFTGYLLLDYSPCKEPSECSFETKGCFEGSALLRFLKKIHMCGSYYVPTIHSSESYVLYIIKSRWNSLCLMGSHLLSIY